jgi:hypothetical protein
MRELHYSINQMDRGVDALSVLLVCGKQHLETMHVSVYHALSWDTLGLLGRVSARQDTTESSPMQTET